MQENSNYLTEQCLIAMPALEDPNFSHTVTYLCQHSAEGALGIVINRPLNMQLKEIFDSMEITLEEESVAQIPVFFGGPVQPERGFILHSPIGAWEGTLTVGKDIGLTASRDILMAIACGRGPEKILVALGYAGWGAGQLEQEMMDNAWLTVPADSEILFDLPPVERWKAAAARIGIDLDLLSTQAGHG